MGASCQPCIGIFNDSLFTKYLRLALQKTNILINEEELTKINQSIIKKDTNQQYLQQCSFKYKVMQNNGQKRSQLQRLIVKDNTSNNAIIIYRDGFYIGKIKSDRADDDQNGRLYIAEYQQQFKYLLKGKWEQDFFKEGKVISCRFQQQQIVNFPTQQQILSISWDAPTKINIKFNPTPTQELQKTSLSTIQSYQGEINPKGKTLTEILSGQGKIKFKDGSTYQGTIRDGLMHTEGISQQATFKSKNQENIYSGHYRKGFKHGYGSSIVKLQGYTCKYTMEWRNGVPVIQTFKLKDRFVSSLFKSMHSL